MIKFCPICGADREMPDDLLAGFAQAPTLVEEALASARSPRAGWTPREVVAHLADSETVFGQRIRRIITGDEPAIQAYDESQWAERLGYATRDVARSLAAFRAMRSLHAELLAGLHAEQWHSGYVHETYGRRTLEELVWHRADHDLQHLAQIVGGGP